MLHVQKHALEIRERLRNPDNAVDDIGIDLKRPAPVVRQSREPVTIIKRLDQYRFKRNAPSFNEIAEVVCEKNKIRLVDLRSARKQANLVYARHIFCYLCRILTTKSFPEPGRLLGGRHHTAIMHGCRKMESRSVSDPK